MRRARVGRAATFLAKTDRHSLNEDSTCIVVRVAPNPAVTASVFLFGTCERIQGSRASEEYTYFYFDFTLSWEVDEALVFVQAHVYPVVDWMRAGKFLMHGSGDCTRFTRLPFRPNFHGFRCFILQADRDIR